MSSIQLCEGKLSIQTNHGESIVVKDKRDIKTIVNDLYDVCTPHFTQKGESFKCLSSKSTLVSQPEGKKAFKINTYRDLAKGITIVFLYHKKDSEGLKFHFDHNVVTAFLDLHRNFVSPLIKLH